jgi:hypothetical protein
MPLIRKKILIVQPDNPQLRLLLIEIGRVAAALKAEMKPVSTVAFANSALEQIYAEAEAASLIVVDVTDSSPAAMYLLGYAHAGQKPVLIMYESADRVPFDVTGVPAFHYKLESHEAFIEGFRALAEDALNNPSRFQSKLKSGSPGTSVFISYCHKDEMFLQRLRIHLRPLERDQRIELWDDSKIKAGQQWQTEIALALKRSKAAILLISAAFLASDFVTSRELPSILQKAASENTLILPVIVSPCRFPRDPNLNRFQAVNDPARPLAELSDVDQERVYDKVCQLIESFGPAVARGGDVVPAVTE